MKKLLLIESESAIALDLFRALNRAYRVECVSRGRVGLNRVTQNNYDLIILDQHLPDMPGLEVCERIRSHGHVTPMLVLGDDKDLRSKVLFLDSGADDYLGKPFQREELEARLRVLSRKSEKLYSQHNRLVVGDLVLDTARCIASRSGVPIILRRKEFRLLECLMRNAGKVVTGTILASQAWESEQEAFSNTLHVHIKHLRDKIDKPFKTALIKTVHGFGYKLEVAKQAEEVGKASRT